MDVQQNIIILTLLQTNTQVITYAASSSQWQISLV